MAKKLTTEQLNSLLAYVESLRSQDLISKDTMFEIRTAIAKELETAGLAGRL